MNITKNQNHDYTQNKFHPPPLSQILIPPQHEFLHDSSFLNPLRVLEEAVLSVNDCQHIYDFLLRNANTYTVSNVTFVNPDRCYHIE